jgi:hypothetical protein
VQENSTVLIKGKNDRHDNLVKYIRPIDEKEDLENVKTGQENSK